MQGENPVFAAIYGALAVLFFAAIGTVGRAILFLIFHLRFHSGKLLNGEIISNDEGYAVWIGKNDQKKAVQLVGTNRLLNSGKNTDYHCQGNRINVLYLDKENLAVPESVYKIGIRATKYAVIVLAVLAVLILVLILI